jgi:hypothetical protein
MTWNRWYSCGLYVERTRVTEHSCAVDWMQHQCRGRAGPKRSCGQWKRQPVRRYSQGWTWSANRENSGQRQSAHTVFGHPSNYKLLVKHVTFKCNAEWYFMRRVTWLIPMRTHIRMTTLTLLFSWKFVTPTLRKKWNSPFRKTLWYRTNMFLR